MKKLIYMPAQGVIHWETETSVSGNVTLAGTPIVNGLQDDGTGGYYGIWRAL